MEILFAALNLTNQSNVQNIDRERQDSLFALRFGRSFSIGLTFRSLLKSGGVEGGRKELHTAGEARVRRDREPPQASHQLM